MKKLIPAIMALAVYPALACAQMPVSCSDFASSMAKQTMDIFHDANKTDEQKRIMLAALFEQYVDTDWIGKYVLGRYWEQATPDQQAEYLKAYKSYITMIYSSKFDNDVAEGIDDVKIASVQTSNSQTIVKTLIKNEGGEDVKADYIAEQTPEKCQVRDINIEGVSLLASQRAEFSNVAMRSGVAGIIAGIKSKLKAE